MNLKDKLQLLRKQNGYSQEQLADKILLLAKKNTYASSQTNTCNFSYKNNSGYHYSDSYIGGEHFSGTEVVRHHNTPVWSMNYSGRIIGENFNIRFLKEALMAVPEHLPFRGPELYTKGDYHYRCNVTGKFDWFQGYEEIFYTNCKIYECHFHGGTIY